MIKAVIFDFDGLILDTEVPCFRAWQEIFRRHGCELTLDLWADYIGRAPEMCRPCEQLEKRLKRPVDRERLHQEQLAYTLRLIEAESVLPGVVDALDGAKRLGLKLAVASSSSRDWVCGYLVRLGLEGRFDCIRCSDDVERTKPAADLYVAVLKALGLQSDEGFAIEDSPHGVAAAKAAGLFCVAVPNGLTKNLSFVRDERRLRDERCLRPDLVLSSLREITFAELVAKVEAASRGCPAAVGEGKKE